MDKQIKAPQQSMIPIREYTPQEKKMIGSSEEYGDSFYKPSVVSHFPEAAEVVNQKRQNAGFFAAVGYVHNRINDPQGRYVLDFPPLDLNTGETLYDPSVWIVGKDEAGEVTYTLSKELTMKVYELQDETEEYDLHHREGKWRWEVEGREVEGQQPSSLETY